MLSAFREELVTNYWGGDDILNGVEGQANMYDIAYKWAVVKIVSFLSGPFKRKTLKGRILRHPFVADPGGLPIRYSWRRTLRINSLRCYNNIEGMYWPIYCEGRCVKSTPNTMSQVSRTMWTSRVNWAAWTLGAVRNCFVSQSFWGLLGFKEKDILPGKVGKWIAGYLHGWK